MAHLGQPGDPPHHRLRPHPGAGRGPGNQPEAHQPACGGTTCLTLGGLGLLVGLASAGFRETAVLAGAGMAPLTGAVLAALILGDRLGITGMAGAAILAAAVMLTMRAHR